MPLSCDCYPGCWGAHSATWPYLPDPHDQLRALVIKGKLLPIGTFVTNNGRLYLETMEHVETVSRARAASEAKSLEAAAREVACPTCRTSFTTAVVPAVCPTCSREPPGEETLLASMKLLRQTTPVPPLEMTHAGVTMRFNRTNPLPRVREKGDCDDGMSWRGLYKLQEEMGELGQVLGKMGPFPHGGHPDGGPPLCARAEAEIADVLAALDYFVRVNRLDAGLIAAMRNVKLEKFHKWKLTGVPTEGQQ